MFEGVKEHKQEKLKDIDQEMQKWRGGNKGNSHDQGRGCITVGMKRQREVK